MNIWEWVLNVLGWIAFVVVIFGFVLLIIGIVEGITKTIKVRKAAKRRRQRQLPPEPSNTKILALAEDYVKSQYGQDPLFSELRKKAFYEGVKFVTNTQAHS